MSKQSAMNLASGTTDIVASPSLTGTPPPAPVEAPVIETAQTETAPVVEKSLDSDRYAKIAKREAQLVREREEIKKQKEWFNEAQKRWTQFEETKSKDPVEALKLVGFSDTEIFNALSGSVPKELTAEEKAEQIAKQQIEAYKKEVEAQKLKEAQEQDQRTLNAFKGRITKTITANPDKYEFCAFQGKAAEDLIYETMLQDAASLKPGEELMTLDEAMEEVESFYENEFKRAMTLKKLKAQEAPVEAAPQPKVEAPVQKSKTLTNAATATIASTIPKKETRSEKRERLMNMLRQGLTR